MTTESRRPDSRTSGDGNELDVRQSNPRTRHYDTSGQTRLNLREAGSRILQNNESHYAENQPSITYLQGL